MLLQISTLLADDSYSDGMVYVTSDPLKVNHNLAILEAFYKEGNLTPVTIWPGTIVSIALGKYLSIISTGNKVPSKMYFIDHTRISLTTLAQTLTACFDAGIVNEAIQVYKQQKESYKQEFDLFNVLQADN
ncbi:hypothetical protein [Mucilaginibacter sp.]|uniref:hypothetical protein n=1 Tax=Mucilaginibacter sp. TaxID=1882438 RepID=UPI00261CB45F|nr:hypothetical protein [Mucilaginibacter sp.]MDB4919468.1 hypothetical protein [Mucilaginibacter sp.]